MLERLEVGEGEVVLEEQGERQDKVWLSRTSSMGGKQAGPKHTSQQTEAFLTFGN